MKDCIIKKKVRKGKTQKETHKRKNIIEKATKEKNNPSWLLLFVPVFIKI